MIHITPNTIPLAISEEWECNCQHIYFLGFDLEEQEAEILYIPFNDCPNIHTLAIDISSQVIGVPEERNSIIRKSNILLIPSNAKKIIPLNFGQYQRIFDYSFNEEIVRFNTFGQIKKYGEYITIKRKPL